MRDGDRFTFLFFYAQSRFWSMGEGKGTPSFSRTITSLVRRGHAAHVFLPREEGQGEGTEDYHGVQLHRVTPPGRLTPRARLPLVPRLWERWETWSRYQAWGREAGLRLARQLRPDLLISLGAFEAPAARAVGEQLDVPNFIRLFGSWLPLEKGIRYYTNFPAIWALRTPAVGYLVTNDGSQGDVIAERLGVPADRFFFLRNGIDLEHFRPGPADEAVRAALDIPKDACLLLSATRLVIEKKLERILEALAALAGSHPDLYLALVGDGEDRERLEGLGASLGVTPRLRFVGAVAHEEMPRYFRSADLVVSLLDRTNTNNPVLEALACGRPVLALETGATHEVVAHGSNGWVLQPDELPELAAKLGGLVHDRAALRRAGARARERITALVTSPEARLEFEVRLYEAAAARRPLPSWEGPR